LAKTGGFLTARAAYEGSDSAKSCLAKDGAEKEAKQAVWEFANTSIRYNPLSACFIIPFAI
jgi:hypothetical protein